MLLEHKGEKRLQEYRVTLRSFPGHAENVSDDQREAFQDSLESQTDTFNTYMIETDLETGRMELVLWVESYNLVAAQGVAYNVFLRAQQEAWDGDKPEMTCEAISVELEDLMHMDESETLEDMPVLVIPEDVLVTSRSAPITPMCPGGTIPERVARLEKLADAYRAWMRDYAELEESA